MNQYKKKMGFLRALFEFRWAICATIILTLFVAPFFVGALIMKIPCISVTKPSLITSWFLGLCGVGVCVAIVGIAIIFKKVILNIIPKVTRDLHAAKIMQYLPRTKEDWKQFDAKTDEDAVRVLRNLVKTIGLNDNFIGCYELRNRIVGSYYTFLDFKYGNRNLAHDVLIEIDDLVLCSDADFETGLEIERARSRKN